MATPYLEFFGEGDTTPLRVSNFRAVSTVSHLHPVIGVLPLGGRQDRWRRSFAVRACLHLIPFSQPNLPSCAGSGRGSGTDVSQDLVSQSMHVKSGKPIPMYRERGQPASVACIPSILHSQYLRNLLTTIAYYHCIRRPDLIQLKTLTRRIRS